jgi:hypothetical protein
MIAPVPLTWRVGVRNRFGWVTQPDGRRNLVEVRMFIGDRVCQLVDLETGGWLQLVPDGSALFVRIDPEAACSLVSIPTPQTDNTLEDPVRVDPFHVERHRGAVFRALCDLAYGGDLPCGYSLLAHQQGRWDPAFLEGAHQDNPEQFATDVGLALSRGEALADAVRGELCADADVDPHGPAADRLMASTRWDQALRYLPAAVAHQQTLIASRSTTELQARALVHADGVEDDAQLALI